MYTEYVPPALNFGPKEHSTDLYPAGAIDLKQWLSRVHTLEGRADGMSEECENPWLRPTYLRARVKIIKKRILAEMEMLGSDSVLKMWMPGEMPGSIK